MKWNHARSQDYDYGNRRSAHIGRLPRGITDANATPLPTDPTPAQLTSLSRYAAIGAVLLLSACAGGPTSDLPESYVRLSIDKSEPERLAAYYFGGYVAPVAANPFERGLLIERDGALYLDIDSLEAHAPSAASLLSNREESGPIDWDELERFIDATYYQARAAPITLSALRREADFDSTGSNWMHVEVDGVMTTARRHIYVPKDAVLDAISHYVENERRLIYPTGTTIIGEHHLDGRRAESTVMRKREDGYWDFFVYGSNDSLAPATTTPPKSLKSPVQCVGCHFGNKLFEPQKSFPIEARSGPHGPRHLYVSDSLRNERIVRFFDEHRKRSDTILGLYGTLFIAELEAMTRAGTLAPEHEALLDSLDL